MSEISDVRHLLDHFGRLRDVDHIDLQALTREELFSLGDRPAFGDSADLAWWGSLAAPARADIEASAQRGLVGRRLVQPGVDPSTISVHPDLRLVLAMRSEPAFLSVIGLRGRPEPLVRAYGVLGEHAEVAAVLLERAVVPGVSDFVLGSAAYAAMAMTRFLFEPPTADDPDAQVVDSPLQLLLLRRFETLLRGESVGVRHLAYAGVTAGALAEVDDEGRSGEPVPVTEQSMIENVLDEWRACAARTAAVPGPGQERA